MATSGADLKLRMDWTRTHFLVPGWNVKHRFQCCLPKNQLQLNQLRDAMKHHSMFLDQIVTLSETSGQNFELLKRDVDMFLSCKHLGDRKCVVGRRRTSYEAALSLAKNKVTTVAEASVSNSKFTLAHQRHKMGSRHCKIALRCGVAAVHLHDSARVQSKHNIVCESSTLGFVAVKFAIVCARSPSVLARQMRAWLKYWGVNAVY